MNTKGIVLVIAIATVFLVAAVGSASATDITDCTEITSPGTYKITTDITNSTAGKCIDIQSDDVILDGQWHKIDGVTPGAGSMYGIYCLNESENRNNVTIKNVEVTHFYVGILAGAKYNDMLEACDYKVEDLTIENCTVHDNGASNAKVHAIEFKPCVWNSTINNCTVYNQLGKKGQTCEDGGAGIRLHTYCYYNNITNNTIHNNALAGIYSKMICRHNYVLYNTVYENGEDVPDGHSYFGGGIRLECINTDNWTVEHNTVTDNWGPGIHVRGKYGTFRYNEERGSRNATTMRGDGSNTGVGDGFFACGVTQTLISNSFCDNTGEDIYISSSTTGDSDENTCNTTVNYNDDGMSEGCDYPCIISCDADGNEKNTFLVNEKVYVKGGGHALSTAVSYTLWIQDDPVNDDDTLISSEDPSESQETVTPTDCGGVPCFGPTEIWDTTGYPGSLKHSDIIVDNQTGGTVDTFNKATDGIDSATVVGFVAPVPELSTIVLLGIGLLTLVGYVRLRREKN